MTSPPQPNAPVDEAAAWQALMRHEPQNDFVYAVVTTGIFCRSGCRSRLPKRENVRFFATNEQAMAAGFRPCQRCRPQEAAAPDETRSRMAEQMRRHLEAHLDRPVALAELGKLAGCSSHTARRIFQLAMGTSPMAYQRALRAHHLRDRLNQGDSVTDAMYAAGYGSASRAYEAGALGMTPARFRDGGRGERIRRTAAETEYGWMAVAATERGLCWLSLAATREAALDTVREEFPAATLTEDAELSRWVSAALVAVEGARTPLVESLDLRGTAFQLRVWEALRRIPRGETRSYSELAREMGAPNSTRAVARACALNRVSLLVPCHRVVGASGALTGYRWGVERKKKLLEAEKQGLRD